MYDIYKCQDLMFPFTDTLVAYLQYIIYIYICSRFIYILDTGQFIVHIWQASCTKKLSLTAYIQFRPDPIPCRLAFNFDSAARLFTVLGLSHLLSLLWRNRIAEKVIGIVNNNNNSKQCCLFLNMPGIVKSLVYLWWN